MLHKSFQLIVVIVLSCTISYGQSIPFYIPTSGLKALYLFSSNTADSSGYAADGVPYGPVTYGTDRFGNPNHCYLGNGSSGVNIPSTNLPIGNHSRSLSAWYKIKLPYTSGIIEMVTWGDNSGVGRRFGLMIKDSVLAFEYDGAEMDVTGIFDTNWHNVIVTYPEPCFGTSSTSVYFDGVLQTTVTDYPITAYNTDSGSIHAIGALYVPPGAMYSWNGSLDEVAVWDRGLTPCEVWQIAHCSVSMDSISAITGIDTMCVGIIATFTDTTTGGVWSVTNSNAIISASGIVIGLSAGQDTIRYTATGTCDSVFAQKVIRINSSSSISPIIGPDTLCYPAEMATVYADSTLGGTWSESNPINHISSSGALTTYASGIDTISYSVSLTGCDTSTAEKTVFIINTPAIAPISGPDFVCVGSTIVLTDTTIGGVWSASNISAFVSTFGVVAGALAGVDTIKYSIANYCGNTYMSHIVNVYSGWACDSALATLRIDNETQIQVYCSNNGIVLVNTGQCKARSMIIYDCSGLFIHEFKETISNVQYDISNRPAGLYFIKIVEESGASKVFKFIKY